MSHKFTCGGGRPRKGNLKGIYRASYIAFKPIVKMLANTQWEGIENIPTQGGFILAPNHLSNFDPISVAYFMADAGYETRFLAKDSLFKVPLVGPFMRKWGMIPVARQSKQATDSLKYAREALADGDVVGIYFEGTLTRDPALWPMKGKTGLARLALDLRIPVIPLVHWGEQDVVGRYTKFVMPRLGKPKPKLHVKALPPLDYSDIEGDSSNQEGVRELTRRLEETITGELAKIRCEEPPVKLWDMKKEGGPSKEQITALSKWRKQLATSNSVTWQNVLPTVVLMFGGQSGEHEVSCSAVGDVLKAIDATRWNILLVGVTKTGQWVPMPNDPKMYDSDFRTVKPSKKRVGFVPGAPLMIQWDQGRKDSFTATNTKVVNKIDVVFPLLHGPFGEDGTLQGLLELSNVNYVGCGVASSAMCMDKHVTNTLLNDAGIDVGQWTFFSKRQWLSNREECQKRVANLGYPVFVKPCRAGSSLGVSKVTSPNKLVEAVQEAQKHDPRIVVEVANSGREIECGLLVKGNGDLCVGSLGEIRMLNDNFYDYDAKYLDSEGTEVVLECPANIPQNVAESIQNIVVKASEVLQVEGIARFDFFYNQKTGSIVLNEVNTMPGFTPYSLYPTMFQTKGVSYGELVNTLIEEAAARPKGLR